MRVLVAGAPGAIGRQLGPLLQEVGHEVIALPRKPDGRDPADARHGGRRSWIRRSDNPSGTRCRWINQQHSQRGFCLIRPTSPRTSSNLAARAEG
jgi:nucleoside-diphosphate-sugar epimerase